LAAISHVFAITYVAELLGEDEDWLHELSIDMFPEDGRLYVCRGKDDALTAFTLQRDNQPALQRDNQPAVFTGFTGFQLPTFRPVSLPTRFCEFLSRMNRL